MRSCEIYLGAGSPPIPAAPLSKHRAWLPLAQSFEASFRSGPLSLQAQLDVHSQEQGTALPAMRVHHQEQSTLLCGCCC